MRTSRSSRLPVLALCAAVVIAGCGSSGGRVTTVSSKAGSGGGGTGAESSSPAVTTAPMSVPSSATPTTTTASATTTAATTATTAATEVNAGPRGSMAEPLMVGTPFTSVDAYGGTAAWTGTVFGLSEVALSTYNEEPGRCLLLVGVINPLVIESGIVSSGYAAPTISLIADGKVVDMASSQCDTSSADVAGYRWLLDAAVTVGTDYPFSAEFFLGGPIAATPEVIVVGDPQGADAHFYEPTLLAALPPPGEVVTVSAAAGRDLQPMGDPTASSFTYTDPYSENAWTGTLLGLVETPQYDGATDPGRCLVLVATMSPTKVAAGVIADPYTEPSFTLIASGRQVPSYGGSCDTTAFDTAGYGDRYLAEVTAGTTFAFRETFFLPGATPEIPEVVVVGDPAGDTQVLFDPTVIPAIPPS